MLISPEISSIIPSLCTGQEYLENVCFSPVTKSLRDFCCDDKIVTPYGLLNDSNATSITVFALDPSLKHCVTWLCA